MMYLCFSFLSVCVFQRSRAFPGHDSEGGESQTGGGTKICGAAEKTVRM